MRAGAGIPIGSEGVATKANYGLNKVRSRAPVKVGSRIRLAARLAKVEEVPGGLQITVNGTIEIDGEAKPAAVLQSVSRFYAWQRPRSYAPRAGRVIVGG